MADKIQWFLLGCVIGAGIGYAVRDLREMKEKVEHMDESMSKQNKDERGFVRFPIVADVMLLIVLALTVYASFASQSASNDVRAQQEQTDKASSCTKEFLDKTITALNERTTYSTKQATTNVDLQKAQSKFLAILLLDPPASNERVSQALEEYFDNLNDFVFVASQTAEKVQQNPYPTPEGFSMCLQESTKE